MLARWLALVFAALIVGAAAQQAFAAYEVPSEVDETPEHTLAPGMVATPLPEHRGAVAQQAPRSSFGRSYAILVFRPPR